MKYERRLDAVSLLFIFLLVVLAYISVFPSLFVKNRQTTSALAQVSCDRWNCPGNQCSSCGINGWWAQGCWDWCSTHGCQQSQGSCSPCGDITLYCKNADQGNCIKSGYRCGNDSCGHPDSTCAEVPTATPVPTLTVTPGIQLSPTAGPSPTLVPGTTIQPTPTPCVSQSTTINTSDPTSLLLALLQILLGGTGNYNNTCPPSPTPATTSITPAPTITKTGNFVYYCQHNSAWVNACGTDLNACTPQVQCGIGYAGCGPTSLAMIISSLTPNSLTPPQVDQVFQQNGWRLGCSAGSYMFSAVASSWFSSLGLRAGVELVSNAKLDLSLAKTFIDNGSLIIGSSQAFPCQSCKNPIPLNHIFVVDNVDIQRNVVSIRDPDNCSWSDGNVEIHPQEMSADRFPWYYAFPVSKL